MTKKELIKALDKFEDYDVVVIGDKETGWTNIGEVKEFDSAISIMPDYVLPFSSNN